MSKLYRVRTKDGFVSPATGMTNVHGIDMDNVLVPEKVGVAIIRGKIDWHDAVRCVASGKDPSILLVKPDAADPKQELKDAPNFDQKKAAVDANPPKTEEAPKIGELALSRAENRAPVIENLTDDELNEQAGLLGIKATDYSTKAGLVRAIKKKMAE